LPQWRSARQSGLSSTRVVSIIIDPSVSHEAGFFQGPSASLHRSQIFRDS
jgi:hypothetical protein